MIKRLRPAHSEEALKTIYATPHNSDRWSDHIQRVDRSIDFIKENCGDIASAADLSCGNGKILSAMDCENKYYGDFAPGYPLTGPINQTIKDLPIVDLFICSETIEHLDNPSETLKLVRQHTNKLFISTPVDKFDDDNLEHYWAWDFEGISDTLTSSGFVIKKYERLELSQNYYTFALVYCE